MKNERQQAASAHERVMMNLSIFHLLLPVVALSSNYISIVLAISLFGSIIMIFSVAKKARQTTDVELVHTHWQVAWKRCRLLLISYAIATVIMLIGLLLASLQSDSNMFSIMLIVVSRIAVVPVVLMVLALFVMSTTSLSQARQGELPS